MESIRETLARAIRAFHQNPTPALGRIVRSLQRKAQREAPNFWFVEFTDTFGGEANYCWVRRFLVRSETPRGAIRKTAAEMGYSGRMRKESDYGDTMRHNVRGAAVCAFTSLCEDPDMMRANYSRLVEL